MSSIALFNSISNLFPNFKLPITLSDKFSLTKTESIISVETIFNKSSIFNGLVVTLQSLVISENDVSKLL